MENRIEKEELEVRFNNRNLVVEGYYMWEGKRFDITSHKAICRFRTGKMEHSGPAYAHRQPDGSYRVSGIVNIHNRNLPIIRLEEIEKQASGWSW